MKKPPPFIREVTITARLHDNGIWEIDCPTRKRQFHSKQLTKPVAILLAEIDDHNEQILQGEPDWFTDPKKVYQAHQGRDWDMIQARKRQAAIEAGALKTSKP